MAKNNNLTDFVTDIANHFRGKIGLPSTSKINPQNFSDYIDTMPHLVDISEQFPDLALNMSNGDMETTIDFPDNFPWKVLPDGESFLPVVVFHAVLSYQFSEVVSSPSGAPGAMQIQNADFTTTLAEMIIDVGDTDLHTESAWWGIVYPPTGADTPYYAGIYYDGGYDEVMKKCTASIKVTPYIVKIGDRVLSLRTCKGEA